jgi:hypothetical protein
LIFSRNYRDCKAAALKEYYDQPGGTVVYPAQPGLICSSICDSVCGGVRAKRGIWSKRVFMRMNGNFSFSVL